VSLFTRMKEHVYLATHGTFLTFFGINIMLLTCFNYENSNVFKTVGFVNSFDLLSTQQNQSRLWTLTNLSMNGVRRSSPKLPVK
jgi:hypothetical protein